MSRADHAGVVLAAVERALASRDDDAFDCLLGEALACHGYVATDIDRLGPAFGGELGAALVRAFVEHAPDETLDAMAERARTLWERPDLRLVP